MSLKFDAQGRADECYYLQDIKHIGNASTTGNRIMLSYKLDAFGHLSLNVAQILLLAC